MHTKVVDLKEYSNKEISLFIQVVLIAEMIIFAIINLITNNMFELVFYAIVSMIMFVMAYNNAKFYKKRYMTSVYIVVGIFVLVTTVMEHLF